MIFNAGANYNLLMSDVLRTESKAEAMGARTSGWPASAGAAEVVLQQMAPNAEMLAYCHDLARSNMQPYQAKRGHVWDSHAWYEKNRTESTLYRILAGGKLAGFLSTNANRYSTPSLHIGDIQLQPECCGFGIGAAALSALCDIAAQSPAGCREITLNVFYDNPAHRLYERVGFVEVSFDGNKIRMSKAL